MVDSCATGNRIDLGKRFLGNKQLVVTPGVLGSIVPFVRLSRDFTVQFARAPTANIDAGEHGALRKLSHLKDSSLD